MCAFVGAGVLTADEGQNDWSVTCERDGQDAGADSASDASSGNTLVSQPSQLIECAAPLTSGEGGALLAP